MAYLDFISDRDLIRSIYPIVKTINKLSAGVGNLSRNSLDPFGALFECAASDSDFNEWKKSERSRQAQKTIMNKIGDFHQSLIGSLEGCEDVPRGQGLDTLNVGGAWCAEIKNKFNTTKGNHKPRLYDDIERWVSHYTEEYGKQFTGYYVQVIPRQPVNLDQPFTPPDSGVRRPVSQYIREISGALFYEKVTGVRTALIDLYKVLPEVLENEFRLPVKLSKGELTNLFRANIRR